MENRINGEQTVIELFSDNRCELRFINNIWLKIHHITNHIKAQLTLSDYLSLFEFIWHDRAYNSGWNIEIEYMGQDTRLIFTANPT